MNKWWWVVMASVLVAWTIPFDPLINNSNMLIVGIVGLSVICLGAIALATQPNNREVHRR